MIKTILVPTDFSKPAANALKYASAMARLFDARLVLIHAFEPAYNPSYVPSGEIMKELAEKRKASDQALKKLADDLVLHKEVACLTRTVEGATAESIVKTALEVHADLIIMGTKGVTNLAEAIMGSNTASVIEKAGCPVLAIPAEAVFQLPMNIAFATAYEDMDLPLMERMVNMFKELEARYTIVHISDKKETDAQQIAQLLAADLKERTGIDQVGHAVLTAKGDIEEQLDLFTRERKIGLLVMSTHHHGFLSRLFATGHTRQMAYHGSVPLLAFHYNVAEIFIKD